MFFLYISFQAQSFTTTVKLSCPVNFHSYCNFPSESVTGIFLASSKSYGGTTSNVAPFGTLARSTFSSILHSKTISFLLVSTQASTQDLPASILPASELLVPTSGVLPALVVLVPPTTSVLQDEAVVVVALSTLVSCPSTSTDTKLLLI
jgi:hypothetical protein